MTPEKVAVLVITGVIAVLLSITLMGSPDQTEKTGVQPAPQPAATPARRPGPVPAEEEALEGFDRRRAAGGGYRTIPKPLPPKEDPAPGAGTTPTPKGPAAGGRLWKIKPKDNLDRIAREVYGRRSAVSEILAANPGLDPLKLRPGTDLKLPPLAAQITTAKSQAPASGKKPAKVRKEGPALAAASSKPARGPGAKRPAAVTKDQRTPWNP